MAGWTFSFEARNDPVVVNLLQRPTVDDKTDEAAFWHTACLPDLTQIASASCAVQLSPLRHTRLSVSKTRRQSS